MIRPGGVLPTVDALLPWKLIYFAAVTSQLPNQVTDCVAMCPAAAAYRPFVIVLINFKRRFQQILKR